MSGEIANFLGRLGINQRSAKRFGERATSGLTNLTSVGALTDAEQSGRSFQQRNYLGALGHGGMAALGVVPGVGSTIAHGAEAAAKRLIRPVAEAIAKRNYLRPLSDFAPTVYHETSLEDAGHYLPHGDMRKSNYGGEYVADTPDLATGQGSHKGVLLQFDAHRLQGQVNTAKPAWDFAFDRGAGEYVVPYAKEGDYKNALSAFTILPSAKTGSVGMRERFKRMIAWHEKEGWTKTANSDGSLTLSRPESH